MDEERAAHYRKFLNKRPSRPAYQLRQSGLNEIDRMKKKRELYVVYLMHKALEEHGDL